VRVVTEDAIAEECFMDVAFLHGLLNRLVVAVQAKLAPFLDEELFIPACMGFMADNAGPDFRGLVEVGPGNDLFLLMAQEAQIPGRILLEQVAIRGPVGIMTFYTFAPGEGLVE